MAKNRKFAALIFLTLFFSAAFHRSFAQGYYVEVPRTFYGGVVAGGNFSQVDGDNFAGYRKVGMNVGGIVYAQIKPKFAASLEILYSQKGSRSHKAQRASDTNINKYLINSQKINLNYAEVPIMLNYFDKRKSHFGAGISYGQLISGTETVQTTPAIPADSFDRFAFKKFDLNFVAGVQLHLVKGLFLNVRFQYSLMPVRKEYYPGFGRASQYNNMWALRLMYLF